MSFDSKKKLLRDDLELLYKQCAEVCLTILKSNKLPDTSFVLFKYIHFDTLFDLLETQKIKRITVVGPIKSHQKYEAFWVVFNDIEHLYITSDFAIIFLNSNSMRGDFLYTLPVWANFLKKILRLFRGVKVTYSYY